MPEENRVEQRLTALAEQAKEAPPYGGMPFGRAHPPLPIPDRVYSWREIVHMTLGSGKAPGLLFNLYAGEDD
jgi:hypothetical protein